MGGAGRGRWGEPRGGEDGARAGATTSFCEETDATRAVERKKNTVILKKVFFSSHKKSVGGVGRVSGGATGEGWMGRGEGHAQADGVGDEPREVQVEDAHGAAPGDARERAGRRRVLPREGAAGAARLPRRRPPRRASASWTHGGRGGGAFRERARVLRALPAFALIAAGRAAAAEASAGGWRWPGDRRARGGGRARRGLRRARAWGSRAERAEGDEGGRSGGRSAEQRRRLLETLEGGRDAE